MLPQLTVLSPPAEDAVSLTQVKAFLRIGHQSEDDLISDLIESAIARLQTVSGLLLVAQTVQIDWQAWPDDLHRGARLGFSPINALNAVRVKDQDGVISNITSQFAIRNGRLFATTGAWPSQPGPGRTIEIEVQAGYASPESVPGDLKEALLRLIASLYGVRSNTSIGDREGGLPADVQAILDARKEVRL